MDIFSDKKIPLFSLDIETTTLDPFSSKIWSVGVAERGKEGKEYFNRGIVSSSSKDVVGDLLQAHKDAGAGLFGETQKAAGSFDGFAKAHASKSMQSINRTMANITSDLKHSAGVLLIQNTKFESSSLDWAADKGPGQVFSNKGRESFLGGLFGQSVGETKQGLFIPESDEISSARKKLVESSYKMRKSVGFSQDVMRDYSEELKQTTKGLENTITKVVKENVAAGKMTTIDLMDISRIYTSKLYEGGGLDKAYIGTGLAVSFLSEKLLDEKEAHTALSDAKQQIGIFEKLNERISAFNKTGVLSTEDLNFAKALTNSDIHDRSFIGAITSSLLEEQGKKGVDLSDENALRKVLDRPLDDYNNIPEKNFNRSAYIDRVVENFIKSPEDTLAELHHHKQAESLTNYKNMSKNLADLSDTSEVLDFNPKKLSNSSKVLLGLSALGAVSVLSSNSRPKEQPLTSYNDLYENVYLGQSYADWQERNNSHKMIY